MRNQMVGDVRLPSVQTDVRELAEFAATGLVRLIDPETRLFCHRWVKRRDGVLQEGISPRYTVMTLLGLHRWELAGGRSAIEIGPSMEALRRDRRWQDNIGDLGLMLWVSAAIRPDDVVSICNDVKLGAALAPADFQKGLTMEMSWFLTGLSYAAPLLPREDRNFTRELAREAYRRIVRNQGANGFFGHQSNDAGLRGWIRGQIGSFADQVYPIYALTQYGVTFGDSDALDRATRCAQAICGVQGELGQWWWHYDAAAGRVFQKYPVYSVHQDGMGPMCLRALAEATGHDYSRWIYSGLSWIYGNNELRCDMRDPSSGMIWRSIYSQGFRRRAREVLDLVGVTMDSTNDLEVLYECRPYHLGWLLYAFAGLE